MVKRKVEHEKKADAFKHGVAYLLTNVKTKDKQKEITSCIQDFLNSVSNDMTKVYEADLVKYLNKITPKYKTSVLNGRKGYIKKFIKWEYHNWSSEFRHLEELCKSRKAESKYSASDMLKKEEIEKLVNCETNIFWKTFLLILFYGCMRPIEVIRLKWKDIEFSEDGAYIYLFCAKNKEQFIKYIPNNVVFYLKQMQNNGSEYVFPSKIKPGQPLNKKSFYFRMKTLAPMALGKKINPYQIRHSVATLLYNGKDKDSDVAQQMGHQESMKKTYSHLDDAAIKERMRRLWIKPENLPPEQKHKLEIEVAKLRQENADIKLKWNEIYKVLIAKKIISA